MADVQLRSVIRHLRRIIGSQGGAHSPSDALLLEAFVHCQDEMALEMLVWRHGTMVLNLCRRILQDEHQAEDAFQTAFLVFVRKAGSIGKYESVGSWLYKVAYRVAHRLRRRLAKPVQRLTEADDLPGREPADDLIWRDLRSLLDEELDLLPEKYRSPIVLCYLQGHTYEEAAGILGCPHGTIRSRLARGREQLKFRLTRRGLALSAAWLATHLSVNASSAAVPSLLVKSTVKAAIGFAAGETANGLVSSSVAALTQGVLRAMFITKLKKAVAIVIAVAILSLGAGSVAHWAMADSQDRQVGVSAQDKDVPKKVEPQKDQPKKGKAEEFEAVIKKVDGDKVIVNRSTKNKKVDDITLTAAKDLEVFMELSGSIEIMGVEIDLAGQSIVLDGGLKNEMFAKGDVKALIRVDEKNNITEIRIQRNFGN